MAGSDLSAAVSHVGRIRSNNQDSGYAGANLFVVADGMGGHAGGDVASAIAVKRIAEVDREFPSANDAEFALHQALLAANTLLAETVFEHSELTGMGTTVSGMLRVGDRVAIAHIGDSRIYRFRAGILEQITNDHTFVQRLVDSGRITAEEAAVHPRRSVLMRVLGDVDASPEIDTTVVETKPGDRWVICSDGLSSYVPEDKLAAVLATTPSTQEAAERMVALSLDAGAPDNVTVVIMDVAADRDSASRPPTMVGSAAAPLSFAPDPQRRPMRIPTLLLHPLKATQHDDSHFEPESDEYLDALIAEDRRRAQRRRATWLVFIVLAVGAIVAGLVLGYQYTQQQYYVGVADGRVAIYQGVQQSLGPIALSHVVETSSIDLDDLPEFQRETVERTINAGSLSRARVILENLTDVADQR
jgi:PPM family protein phosphatase